MAEQYNMQTGFIDGSGVYGPNEVNIVEEERGVESFKSFCPYTPPPSLENHAEEVFYVHC